MNDQETLMIAVARAAPVLYSRPDVFMFGVNLKTNPIFRLADTE
jgi:hypothetical protein